MIHSAGISFKEISFIVNDSELFCNTVAVVSFKYLVRTHF